MEAANVNRRVTLPRAVGLRLVVALVGLISLVAALPDSPQASAQAFTCAGEAATLVGTPGPDLLKGTPGRDVIIGLGGADVIHGRGGADLICAGAGPDRVFGGVGPDVVYAGAGRDTVNGGDGHDVIRGGDGPDVLQGNRGADRVLGGAGRDQVMGGVGLDVVSGGPGSDRVSGGGGTDQVDGGAGVDRCSTDDVTVRCESSTAGRKIVVEPAPDGVEIRVERVVHISIDGLRSDYVTGDRMPFVSQLRSQAASTLNARNDPDLTNTLPNHTSQITGRPIEGPNGHGVDFNDDNGRTVHDSAGSYVASVYDVVHDRGLGTAAYVNKEKFNVHLRSWNGQNGARDITGVDDGRDKIDVFVKDDPADSVDLVVADLDDYAYVFFHIRLPDSAGHASDWGSPAYADAVRESDDIVDDLVSAIRANGAWSNSTAVIITSDHGGPIGQNSHFDAELPGNYTIPFIVWAPGVAAGGDLYDLNPQSRRNPGGAQVGLEGRQPVRGHEAGNLALDLLGLPPIPGSVFNAEHDLAVR